MTLITLTLIIGLVVCFYISVSSDFGSLWSPYGMVGTVLCSILLIPESFKLGNAEGYLTVSLTTVFYILLIRTVQLYNKYSKD